ncbi:MAG TPA: ParB N-terminal domain-containing protein [Gemmataceae bacterium]|nr:ParB N-terminal domain-containing protein [Bryobacteraceae bacterium]HZV06111.1 ParB N-terminal domain-containing protein [Gemmataceae bacterium]
MTSNLDLREVPGDSIRVVGRHRRDMGELEVLAASIATVGLLHPPVITEDGRLICGERRLRAMRDILRWTMIPVTVLQVSTILDGEYAENEIRKDFTPSERVEIGKALEAQLGERRGRDNRQNVAELKGRRSDDLAAQKAGFGNRTTYEQAKKVVERAVAEVVAQMDTGDLSVNAAAVIAEQPSERQREIAQMPEGEKKAAVRKLRRQDLPTPTTARKQALESGMAILDRNLNYQLPTPESQRPVVERNYAAMAIADAARAISGCQHSALEIAAGIRSLDTPDMDFAGHCRKAAAFLEAINQEIERNENK